MAPLHKPGLTLQFWLRKRALSGKARSFPMQYIEVITYLASPTKVQLDQRFNLVRQVYFNSGVCCSCALGPPLTLVMQYTHCWKVSMMTSSRTAAVSSLAERTLDRRSSNRAENHTHISINNTGVVAPVILVSLSNFKLFDSGVEGGEDEEKNVSEH